MVTLDRPAVHGGTGVDPLHDCSKKTNTTSVRNDLENCMQLHCEPNLINTYHIPNKK